MVGLSYVVGGFNTSRVRAVEGVLLFPSPRITRLPAHLLVLENQRFAPYIVHRTTHSINKTFSVSRSYILQRYVLRMSFLIGYR